jgi:hypothetical protein
MKGSLRLLLPAGLVVLTGLACSKPQPIVPKKPVASGSVLMYFTKKVTGPMELTIDGTRIPVTRAGKGSRFRHLEVDGLAQGHHRVVLMSALEAFGPDQFDVDLGPGQGEFRVLFAQNLKSVLYGSPEPVPATAGLPGVRARLEP